MLALIMLHGMAHTFDLDPHDLEVLPDSDEPYCRGNDAEDDVQDEVKGHDRE